MLISPISPSFSDFQTDVVVMGGGPVGLDAAIKIRKRTGKNVTVLEKHEIYQRTDIKLLLASASLKGLSEIDDELKAKTREWTAKRVPISEIEDVLTRKAHEYGIKIIKPCEANPLDLETQFPNADVLIGADGARSNFRQKLLGEEYAFNQTHQHVINVQYRITPEPGSDEAKLTMLENYRRLKLANYYIAENRTKLPDGDIAVSLQIFVDEETYNSMKPATFKNPYYFDESLSNIPQELKNVLIKWWGNEKGTINQDDERKNKISVIKLGSYCAKNVCSVENGKVKAIVGDAATATPFFQAINNGFKCSTELAGRVEEGYKTGSFEKPMRAYSRFVHRRATIDRIKALFKSCYINLTHVWIRVSNKMPWSTIKVSKAEKVRIIARGTEIMERLIARPSYTRDELVAAA